MEEGDNARAQQALNQALLIAQREHDPALELRTLVRAVNVDLFHFNFEEGVERGYRAIELAEKLGDHRSRIIVLFYLSRILEMRGDRSEAKKLAEVMLDLSRATRERYNHINALLAMQQVTMAVGDWSTARDFNVEALGLAPLDPRLLLYRAWLEHEVGDFGEGALHLDRILELIKVVQPAPTTDFGYTAALIPLIARMTGVIDRIEASERAGEHILSSPTATPLVSRLAEAGRALTEVVRDDVSQSQVSYESLEPNPTLYSVQVPLAALLTGSWGSSPRPGVTSN